MLRVNVKTRLVLQSNESRMMMGWVPGNKTGDVIANLDDLAALGIACDTCLAGRTDAPGATAAGPRRLSIWHASSFAGRASAMLAGPGRRRLRAAHVRNSLIPGALR